MLSENTTAGWRTELWVRCEGMGDALRRRFATQRTLSETDVEDVWSAMVTRVVQAPGPGTLPADADRWPDRQLRKWLRTTFEREVWRAAKRSVTADGALRHASLDDLGEGVRERGVISRDAAPSGPEAEVFARLDALQYASGIEDIAGPEAARLLLADAIGATPGEQQNLLGIKTRSPYQTLRGRLEIAGNAMSARVQSVVVWVLPDSLVRWLGPLVSSGPAPRIGAVGLVIAALTAGGAGVSTATHRPAPRQALHARVGTAAAHELRASAPVAVASASQHAARRIQVRAQAKVAARRSAAARRRSEHKAAIKRTADARAAADRQFSRPAITASPASVATSRAPAAAPKVTRSDKTAADAQFGLGN